jgi:NAD(P)-dependent dehydrogenase (short-subunit alcohol dehydrogenase family)
MLVSMVERRQALAVSSVARSGKPTLVVATQDQTVERRVALVTGGNRGLGLETCRQLAARGYLVVLTSRDSERGRSALERLKSAGYAIEYERLDVTRQQDVERVTEHVVSAYGRVDVLVNNAGVLLDRGWPVIEENMKQASALVAEIEALRGSMETNAFGAFRMCQRFVPLMVEWGYGRVVNVTSAMGRLSKMGAGWAGYRMSKAALNAVTRIFAAEVGASNVLVNSAVPGWVRTRMGGSGAPLDVEEGVDTIVWLATLPDGGPSGKLFEARKVVGW